MSAEAERPRVAATTEDDSTTPHSCLDNELLSLPLENVLEALLLASDAPISIDRLQQFFQDGNRIDRRALRQALGRLDRRYAETACELQEVAGGWRLQVRSAYSPWVARLQQERPPKISRAMLEVLAIIVYQQPVTRGEIEEIRGVTVSTNVLRSLLERGWVRELGHKETLGRPMLYGTTQQFLDDLNLHSLSQLPELPEIKDMSQLESAISRISSVKASASGDETVLSEELLEDRRSELPDGTES